MVVLVGDAYEVGKRLGACLRPWIQERVAQLRNLPPGEGPDEGRMHAFQVLLEQEAPHWLREAAGLAAGAGVETAQILALNCTGLSLRIPSCTSVAVAPDRSWEGHALLLKIRDERPQHQITAYRHVGGTAAMLFGGDPCNLGVAQGCNRYGLAVANNTGGALADTGPPVGFNDCHVTRLILERARTEKEALAVFRGLVRRRRVASLAGGRGMILLVQDWRGGATVVVEGGPRRFAAARITTGFAVWTNHWRLASARRFAVPESPQDPAAHSSRTRYARAVSLLQGLARIGVRELEDLARDEANAPHALCNVTDRFPWRTVSAFIHVLDPEERHPVRVAAGAPCRTTFWELPRWREDTPDPLLLRWQE